MCLQMRTLEISCILSYLLLLYSFAYINNNIQTANRQEESQRQKRKEDKNDKKNEKHRGHIQ